jgi:hypothetical protein
MARIFVEVVMSPYVSGAYSFEVPALEYRGRKVVAQ